MAVADDRVISRLVALEALITFVVDSYRSVFLW